MNIIDIFSTREIALFIWLTIAIGASLFSDSMRSAIWGVVKAFFSWKLFRIWLIMVIYFAFCTVALFYLKIWDVTLLKDTIFFVLFSASVTFFKANEISEEKGFFKEMLKDNLKLGMLMEFLIGLYTFGLLTELLILPIGIFFALLLVVSNSDIKYIKVKKLLNGILNVAGIYLIYHIISAVIYHFRDLLSIENLKEILFSPIYTILYIPFLYLLSIRMVYEVQYILLETAIKEPSLKKLAKKYAFRYFRQDIDGLKRWVKRVRFVNPQSESELSLSIKEFKAHLILEKAPPDIPSYIGWSPYKAINFMDDEKLKAGNYDRFFENEWGTCSGFLYIGNKDWMNTLSYYVNGNETEAHSLELSLKVFSPNQPSDLHQQFLNHIQSLFAKAVGGSFPRKMADFVVKGKPSNLSYLHYVLELKKEKWQNHMHGYNLVFTMSVMPSGYISN